MWDIVTRHKTWDYCYGPKTKQKSIIWVHREESKPTKLVRERNPFKRMIASSFNKTGYVITVAFENSGTVSSDRCSLLMAEGAAAFCAKTSPHKGRNLSGSTRDVN
ncbi:hypothetical protein EVAR_5802_1 [Eumeta japonica]|uniref:Uncharacterized protein n=1 Tax=Eumeta variegata TaxID=151549 RepID=A0A4C1T7G3_EUMVA|nr:hypothetical protein EVAR_5802_1 [Eumeta japonica]